MASKHPLPADFGGTDEAGPPSSGKNIFEKS
jgi:hypothetical protein